MIAPPAWLRGFIDGEQLPEGYARILDQVATPLVEKITAAPHPMIVGICGSQGSGKSTLALALERVLAMRSLRAATLSLDDLYLTRGERQNLARNVHPLLLTRGPPGTHGVGLGIEVIDRLKQPGEVPLPRFDKAQDTRKPFDQWDVAEGPVDVILFEGWCVGARPQDAADLVAPANALERDEDPQGVWRGYINDALAGPYQDLFGRIDFLLLLQAPSFEAVLNWRTQQEHKLKARLEASGADLARTMSDAQVERFIAHYERLTRHILTEMPGRADMVAALDADRQVTSVRL